MTRFIRPLVAGLGVAAAAAQAAQAHPQEPAA
jgi:hypothetical protein